MSEIVYFSDLAMTAEARPGERVAAARHGGVVLRVEREAERPLLDPDNPTIGRLRFTTALGWREAEGWLKLFNTFTTAPETTAPTRDQTCANCRAFQPHPTHKDAGECRRKAPALDDDTGEGRWPVVIVTEWCCEWLPHRVRQTPEKADAP